MTTSREETRPAETETEDPDVDEPEDRSPHVNAREVHDERIVFTEEGNSDGWISTDLAVTPAQ